MGDNFQNGHKRGGSYINGGGVIYKRGLDFSLDQLEIIVNLTYSVKFQFIFVIKE